MSRVRAPAELRVEQGAKRIRGYLQGRLVVDCRQPRLVWEVPHYPAYWFPVDDVHLDLLAPGNTTGAGEVDDPRLAGLVRIDWAALDHWFEEDEEVFTHPRDPYTRVDVLHSSRHVRVEHDGEVLAESPRPTLLFETGLPPRLYLPPTDVRLDLLVPSATTTRCPYKGTARYWSVRVRDRTVDDLVWSYPAPFPECQKIAGLMAFYNERVDLVVDGAHWERPRTKFS